MWNTNLLIDGDGNLINHHRKLVPTFYEKLIWAAGDGRLACRQAWQDRHVDLRREHQSARALLADRARRTGAHFILSAGVADTAAERGRTLRPCRCHPIRAGAHSFEAKVFNVVSSGFLDKRTREAFSDRSQRPRHSRKRPHAISMVLGPSGEIISGTFRRQKVFSTRRSTSRNA